MTSRTTPGYDDLDNYAVEDFDDPFRTPPPDGKELGVNKRKQGEALGLEEEVEVNKRARVPRVKLDEARLLSDNGIPKLRKRAADLQFKGKGHEFSDAARLLSFYQLWLDDLFPKAKFLDAVAMVEKTGHKKQIAHKRLEWINEGKPNPWEADDAFEVEAEIQGPVAAEATASAPASITQKRPKTPQAAVPDEDDIYGATPVMPPKSQALGAPKPTEEPDGDDDLDALMAEAEMADRKQSPAHFPHNQPAGDDFEDEEAAMAEMGGLW
ncbi:chromosome segregation in meiosis- protein [Colletotrichum tropicale]|nr:chromosome segregation in meiosis- protein [Colletotrichum tropicale]